MKFLTKSGLLFACLVLSACGPRVSSLTALPPRSFPLGGDQAVLVEVDTGLVQITGGGNGNVQISGTLSAAQAVDYSAVQSADGIHVVAHYKGSYFFRPSEPPVQLDLQVPTGARVLVQTYDAATNAQDFHGSLQVTSTAGNILLENATGQAVLKSNRGDIRVQNSSGEIDAIGNYGLISLVGVQGKINASTIVGTIQFGGRVGAGDAVDLETDHGPVQIDLDPTSAATVQVRTTSGVVTCMVPGVSYNGAACDGSLGMGAGQLQVRTVSGSVLLELSH